MALGSAAFVLAAGMTPADALGQQAGGAAAGASSQPAPVPAIVRGPTPGCARPWALIVGKVRHTIAQDAKLPGLMFKAVAFERDGIDFGGLYFPRDRPAAAASFDDAWHARVVRTHGQDAMSDCFDTLILVPSLDAANLAAARALVAVAP